jgi:FMN-dependent NADH-azoreductase
MTNILYLSSSVNGSASYAKRAAAELIEQLKRERPDASIIERDLARDPLPHIDEDFVTATRSPDGPKTDRQRALLARSDALVDELMAADIVVIAVGMINFSIPSTLKSWIDFVARAGRTFRYTPEGPQGLVTGKQVIVVAARGGVYSGEGSAMDFQVPYLRKMLAFLGMIDVSVFEVEGTAFGVEAAEQSVAATVNKIRQRCAEKAAA